ncbi:Cell cycle checkpoint control protein RAD9B, partial [Dryobates pubescens]
VFGRAIHAIARISDEFWFDPVEKGLALRSVNSSRSAYAYVFFSSMFFQHYCWAAVSQPCQKEKRLSVTCKLVIKSVLPIFRSVNVLERNVEKCSISANTNDHHITFQFLCRHGVVKTYNLTFQECDPLQAVFAKNMCPNVLKVHSRLLADIMIHFPSSQEEITLSVTPMKVCFKSYTEEDTVFSKTMLTEIQLHPDEFDYFQVGVDSEVTFCLKELRGLLAFSDAISVPVSIHFDISGRPIAFSIEDMVLEASFILATLSEVEKETASQKAPCSSQQEESAFLILGIGQHCTDAGVFHRKTELEGFRNIQHDAQQQNMVPQKALCWLIIESQTGKTENTSVDKDCSTTAGASKKQQWSRNAPEAVESASPWAKQEMKGFHSLFFGAVSCKEKDASSHTNHSLATASDTEEDLSNVQSSPV